MDNLSIAAISGLQSRMVSLDLLANNLANSATGGYKSDREYYGLYSSDDSQNSIDGGTGTTLPVVERQWTDFSPGTLQTTGNPLDVAIPGKGFFAINGRAIGQDVRQWVAGAPCSNSTACQPKSEEGDAAASPVISRFCACSRCTRFHHTLGWLNVSDPRPLLSPDCPNHPICLL